MTYRNNGSYLRFPAANFKAKRPEKPEINLKSPLHQAEPKALTKRLLNDQSFVTTSQNVYDQLKE